MYQDSNQSIKIFTLLSNLKKLTDEINVELQIKWFYYKDGFVDYWKGF